MEQFDASYKSLFATGRDLSSSSNGFVGMYISPDAMVFIMINIALMLIVYTGVMCMNTMGTHPPMQFIDEDGKPPIGKES